VKPYNVTNDSKTRKLNDTEVRECLLQFGAKSFISQMLSKNIKLKLYIIVILPFVLYGCESWSLKLRDKHRLTVFENRMQRKIFRPKRDEVIGKREDNTRRSSMICIPQQILFGWSNK
jgi:hypothetical protein